MIIEIPVRSTIIVNGKKYICKERKRNNCQECALRELNCTGMNCCAFDRTDNKWIYFEPLDGVLFDQRPVKVNLDSLLPY